MSSAVVIVGQHYSQVIDVVWDLAESGYEVHVALITVKKSDIDILRASRYPKSIDIIEAKNVDEGDMIRDCLLSYRKTINAEKVMFFPVGDALVYLMDCYRDAFEKAFVLPVLPNMPKGGLIRLMDKDHQCRLAREAGLNVPKGWIIDLAGQIEIPEDVTYPCYCKTLRTVDGKKLDQRKCEDREALMNHLQMLQSKNAQRKMFVQEYIDIATEGPINGICLENEIWMPGAIDKIEFARYTPGLAILFRMVPFDYFPGYSEIIPKLEAFLRSTGFIGMLIPVSKAPAYCLSSTIRA